MAGVEFKTNGGQYSVGLDNLQDGIPVGSVIKNSAADKNMMKYKNYVATDTSGPVNECAWKCFSSSGCDMFEYTHSSGSCKYTPHLGLKQK